MMPALFAAAILGLADATYLLGKRYGPSPKPLVCPLGQHCGDVLDSRYGRLLGFRNEILGAAYYLTMLTLLVAARRGSALPFSLLGSSDPLDAAFLIAVPAALAAVALTGIQAFVLKNWCSYCLFANAVNVFLLIGLLLS